MRCLRTGFKMRKLIEFGLYAILFLASCDRETLDKKTVIIENSLEEQVSLKFYNRGTSEKISNFSIDGPGRMFERTLELQGVVTETDVLEADSILVIFNGQSFERHSTDNLPRGNSLFNGSSYEQQSEDVVLYIIDEKNLSNAQPCTGNCD